jgi:hypothetical protein
MGRPKYNLEGTTEYLENKRYRKQAEKHMDEQANEIIALKKIIKEISPITYNRLYLKALNK